MTKLRNCKARRGRTGGDSIMKEKLLPCYDAILLLAQLAQLPEMQDQYTSVHVMMDP